MNAKNSLKSLLLLFALFTPAALFAKIEIVVSILPQKYFVQKLADGLANVTVMVAPGASPATYEPKPSQMRSIAKADIYFSIGVPFEKAWLPRFASQNPNMKIADVTVGIKKMPMVSHHHNHDNDHDGPHSHRSKSLDPHIWLSPRLVKAAVQNMADTLKELDPKNSALYEKNLASFKRELDNLDRRLKETLEPCRGEAMMVFHPSWGYFAKDYGLKQVPIEMEGKEPKSRDLIHLIKEAKEERVKTLFVQPQFSKRTAEVIAESIGAKIVVADPLASNWSENLLKVAKSICKVGR